jgi:hypothetical protein
VRREFFPVITEISNQIRNHTQFPFVKWNYTEYPEYSAIIAKYPRAFQNGACFPDWGYVVGASDAAEAAHWVGDQGIQNK